MRGLALSPLFTSTQRTLMGFRPVRCIASANFLSSQTPFSLKYRISSARAARQRSGGSGWPVRSSTKRSCFADCWLAIANSSLAVTRLLGTVPNPLNSLLTLMMLGFETPGCLSASWIKVPGYLFSSARSGKPTLDPGRG